MKTRNLAFLIIFLLSIRIFSSFFYFNNVGGGDWDFIFPETLKDFSKIPLTWDLNRTGLLGSYDIRYAYMFFYHRLLPHLLNFFFNLNYGIIEKLTWFWPFLFLVIYSPWYLFRVFALSGLSLFLGLLIYIFNSYILMIVGGGQMGIAISYALMPLVLALFIKSLKEERFKYKILSSLTLALSLAYDPRITFLTIGIIFLYSLVNFKQFNFRKYLASFLFLFLIPIGLHFYWILPSILVRGVSLPENYGQPEWVKFLSFAQFSNSISLLHPNWPENIFGKISFMRWEFLMIPIIAYASLLFIGRTRRATDKERISTNVLFFASLGLIGAFLAKGTNPPFGEIYLWLFNNFPGMNMFRDSTKFYTLVALSYSVLIPYSTSSIYNLMSLKFKVQSSKLHFKIQNLFLLLTILYLLFLIRPAWMGQLGGTFKSREVSKEYLELKNFLSSQPEFFRTLWIPQKHRFGFYSNNHPILSSQEFISPANCREPLCTLVNQSKKPGEMDPLKTSEEEVLAKTRDYSLSYLDHPDAPKVLSQMGVKYIVVPYDPEGEIFLMDRKYDAAVQDKYLALLNKLSWLKKIEVADKITIYELPEYKNHFWGVGEKLPIINSEMISPTKYRVGIKNAIQPFDLIFSETYDGFWQAKVGDKIISSEKFSKTFNSFHMNGVGDFEVTVEFGAQKYVRWGMIITLEVLGTLLFFLFRKTS